MLVKFTTSKTVSEAATALKAAIQENSFDIMRVHNFQEAVRNKGVESTQEVLIIEVCPPQHAKKVFDENRFSTLLPCRISIYEADGQTVLATKKPTKHFTLINTPQLEKVAQDMEDTIVKIMTEAANISDCKTIS